MSKRTIAPIIPQHMPETEPVSRMKNDGFGVTRGVASTHSREYHKVCPFCHTGIVKRDTRACSECGTVQARPLNPPPSKYRRIP